MVEPVEEAGEAGRVDLVLGQVLAQRCLDLAGVAVAAESAREAPMIRLSGGICSSRSR